MAWMGIMLFLLFITPVRAGFRLEWTGDRLRGAAGAAVWGLRAQAALRGERNAAGRLTLTAALGDRRIPLPRGKGNGGLKKLLGLMRSSNGPEALLRRAVRVECCQVVLHLGGQDAAVLALGAGLLRALAGALPFPRLFCVPALGGKSGLRAVCIAETRLGILLAAWLIGSGMKRAGKKERGGGLRRRFPLPPRA